MKRLIIAGILLAVILSTAGCNAQKNEATVPETNEAKTVGTETDTNDKITDQMALAAIKNYCCIKNPDLKEGIESGKYFAEWEISSTDEAEVVVLYRSYTSALVRYYIDRATGDTYVTEFVSGITPEEERTDESFNIKDYMR